MRSAVLLFQDQRWDDMGRSSIFPFEEVS
jgi:hypothetical protein